VELWRIVAAVLLGVAGIVIVLLTMAKVRERRGSTSGTVAISGAVTFTVLAILCVLVLTVFAPWLVWTVVIGVSVVTSVMMLAS
jgi:hypothetical protein